MMKKIELKATGLELMVPDCFHFHDDGLVPSTEEHLAKLKDKYGVAEFVPRDLQGNSESVLMGRYYILIKSSRYAFVPDALNAGQEVYAHIFVRGGEPEFSTLLYRGHEETHILDHLNRLDLLRKALEREGMIKVAGHTGIDQEDKEVICDIGGFLAVMKRYPGERNFYFEQGEYPGSRELDQMIEWITIHSDIRIARTAPTTRVSSGYPRLACGKI